MSSCANMKPEETIYFCNNNKASTSVCSGGEETEENISPIYLDYNATTPVFPEVLETINRTLKINWANPSCSYPSGERAKRIVEKSRKRVAIMISCDSDEIIFTSGGTESNNMVIHTAVQHFASRDCTSYPPTPKPHIITTNIEHDSIKLPLEALHAAKKIDVTFVPVSKTTGAVEVDDIMAALRPATCLITVMLANNETGVIQPVEEISARLRELQHTALFHTDAAQALGKIPVSIENLGVDYMTIVGHKFYGPRIGALYVKRGKPLHPLFYGGGQEMGYRPGTENTCMIAGLGKASHFVAKNYIHMAIHMCSIRDYLEEELKLKFNSKVVFHVKENVQRLPNTTSVAFNYPDVFGGELLRTVSGVYASTGAACHTGGGASPILLASGVSEDLALRTIRLSVGIDTTKSDIDEAVKRFDKALSKLHSCSSTEADRSDSSFS